VGISFIYVEWHSEDDMRTIAGESHAPVPITRLLKLGCAPANNRVLALSSPQDNWTLRRLPTALRATMCTSTTMLQNMMRSEEVCVKTRP
jgi:hypothetical protein